MFNRPKLLLSIASLIARGNPRDDMNISDWLVLLLVADYKGWLYYAFDEDKLSMAAVAYRVKEVSEETNHNLPTIEEGDILFVPFVVSFTKDKSRISKFIYGFKDFYKEIKQVSFMTRNNKIRNIDIRRESNGQE